MEGEEDEIKKFTLCVPSSNHLADSNEVRREEERQLSSKKKSEQFFSSSQCL